MVDHHSYHLPLELNAKAPEFPRQCLAWAFEAKCEIMELIKATKNEMEISRALMAEADRILARNRGAALSDAQKVRLEKFRSSLF